MRWMIMVRGGRLGGGSGNSPRPIVGRFALSRQRHPLLYSLQWALRRPHRCQEFLGGSL